MTNTNKKPHYIYSEYLGEMIPKSFKYKGKKYEWFEPDLVYYNMDTEEDYFSNIPDGATF